MSDKKKQDVATIRALAVWAGVTVGVIAFFVVLAAGAEVVYARLYENQIFPGVRILNVRVDGLTKDEARETVQKAVDEALAKGLRFRFHGQEVQLDATVATADPDAARDLVLYNLAKAVDQAYDIGRGNGWRTDILEQLGGRIQPIRISGDIMIDENNIEGALRQALKDKLVPAKDASFTIRVATGTSPLVGIVNEQSGLGFSTKEAFEELRLQAERLAFDVIPLKEEKVEPRLHRTELEPLTGEVEKLLQRPPLTFAYQAQKFPIPTAMLAGWVTVIDKGGKPGIALDPERFHASMLELAPDIEQETKNGSLEVEDGKIVSFKAGTQGVVINPKETLKSVETDWPEQTTFQLVTDITSGSLLGDDPERLGIKEIVGVGTSNFSGSPVNRRKNIAKGAQKVNGSLIASGEEFSLLKTLGKIDGVNGWLPELVIKGNKTTPEFGGGLCQIGTTTFRGALNSGLKITERRNHSYRVRYYEPAGTDATIYEPSPDFKFVNDTGHYILINAYLKGDEVIFEFWGTKDGRTVAPIKSRVYNIVSPPPTKLIETLDLPPGKKKCTESAHAGADADFKYTVTYADGTKHEEVFTSHYRPWQAVCLIGVEALTVPPDLTTQEPAVN